MALWLCRDREPIPGRCGGVRWNLDERICPAILAGGIWGTSIGQSWIEDDGVTVATAPAVPGKPPYRVPSMAEVAAIEPNGYTMVSTFSGGGGSCLGFEMAGFKVAWASEFIPAAQDVYRLNHPKTVLDTRDIRQVTAQDILETIGLEPGQLDVLEGSPPCAAFSTAGKRQKTWGKTRKYSDGSQKTDDLFFEYARLLEGLQPRAFVAENVSGLVKGVAKGYFLEILKRLQGCGYVVEARLLDASWLGVPQSRQRIIFQGLRKDIAEQTGLKPRWPKPLPYQYTVRDALPWLTAVKAESHGPNSWDTGDVLQLDSAAPTVGTWPQSAGYYHHQVETEPAAESALANAVGAEWDKLKVGEQSDRYFNLVRPDPDQPSPAVTAIGGTSAASVTHPYERRKFTIAELRRLCAFPDDFQLTGSYAQQWERLGRAVPPLMMRAVASEVRDLLREVDQPCSVVANGQADLGPPEAS